MGDLVRISNFLVDGEVIVLMLVYGDGECFDFIVCGVWGGIKVI